MELAKTEKYSTNIFGKFYDIIYNYIENLFTNLNKFPSGFYIDPQKFKGFMIQQKTLSFLIIYLLLQKNK